MPSSRLRPAQAFSCEFCEIFKSTFFYKTHLVASSLKKMFFINYYTYQTGRFNISSIQTGFLLFSWEISVLIFDLRKWHFNLRSPKTMHFSLLLNNLGHLADLLEVVFNLVSLFKGKKKIMFWHTGLTM